MNTDDRATGNRRDDGNALTRGPQAARGVWAGWAFACLGGLLVIVAIAVAVTDPCVDTATGTRIPGCDGRNPALIMTLALAGTAIAVVGGAIATVLALRQRAK